MSKTLGELKTRAGLDFVALAALEGGQAYMERVLTFSTGSYAGRMLSLALGYGLPWLEDAVCWSLEHAGAKGRQAMAEVLLLRGQHLGLAVAVMRGDRLASVRRALAASAAVQVEAGVVEVAQALEAMACGDADPQVRAEALWSLRRAQAGVAPEVLVRVLGDGRGGAAVCRAAALARKMPQNGPLMEVLRFVAQKSGVFERLAAMRALSVGFEADVEDLGRGGDPAWMVSVPVKAQVGPLLRSEAGRETLLGMAMQADVDEVYGLVDALGGHRKARGLLVGLLEHPDQAVRQRVCLHIHKEQDVSLVEALRARAAKGDVDAARALVDPWKGAQLQDELIALASRPELRRALLPGVARAAVSDKGLRRAKGLFEVLASAAEDSDPEAQYEAIKALTVVRGREAAQVFMGVLDQHIERARRFPPAAVMGSGPEVIGLVVKALKKVKHDRELIQARLSEAASVGLIKEV